MQCLRRRQSNWFVQSVMNEQRGAKTPVQAITIEILKPEQGQSQLQVLKLRQLSFETAIIERYKRREASVEEALIEMYLAGVSVRRVEDITEALWGTKVSSGTVSNLNKKIYGTIEQWRNRPITENHPFIYVDGISLKRSWGGEVRNISVLVCIGVNQEGSREILGVAEGAREDTESWRSFLRYLKQRGLSGVELIISDKSLALLKCWESFISKRSGSGVWCIFVVMFLRLPPGERGRKWWQCSEPYMPRRIAARQKAVDVVKKLETMRLGKAAGIVREGLEETLSYMNFPREFWRRIRTNNPLERIMREIRRRTRVVGNFPDGESALMLVAARLRHIASTNWSTKQYLNMKRLEEIKPAEAVA